MNLGHSHSETPTRRNWIVVYMRPGMKGYLEEFISAPTKEAAADKVRAFYGETGKKLNVVGVTLE